MDGKTLRLLRAVVQGVFILWSVYVGVVFYRFVMHFVEAGYPLIERPASVEAFLPIGGFMALKYFAFTGNIDIAHPAGFIIFSAAIVSSIAAKKGFCGWICPVGTISEYTWKLGEKVMGRNFRLPLDVDVPLRAAKYLLMLAFIMIIGIAMTPTYIVLFFITDYYKMVDVRMLMLFVEMSRVSAIVFGSLFVLSFLYKNFWCRYLCPYGALLGLLSKFSPLKIATNADACIHCGNCTKACPALIEVEKQDIVTSAECIGCLSCVSHCPGEGGLGVHFRPKATRKRVEGWVFPVVVLAAFYLIIIIGMATGTWQTQIPYETYQELVPKIVNSAMGK